ncbi:hypothetical protein ABB30_11075 [Stenotrophomonas ginsengisoli]|uniref:Transmembrane protein n=1 Tax=Stenotrophomonas ginsengisoli TaxID=336566 RepID=A0A0R0D2V0_9GAMM|nr:hypothetical protein ABB30_11075 [Stenotrophomonas ginsengisoli]
MNFLFGLGLAAWAMSHQRSALFWFLFGWVLAPVAGVVMLILHRRHIKANTTDPKFSVFPQTGRGDLMSTRKDVI